VLRSGLSVIVGYCTAAAFVFAIHLSLGAAFPHRFPRPESGIRPPTSSYLIVMGLGIVPGLAGGYVVAAIARRSPLRHAMALGAVLFLLGGLSAIFARGQQPLWYLAGLATLGTVGALLGAKLKSAHPRKVRPDREKSDAPRERTSPP